MPLYDMLRAWPPGFTVCADSAFPATGDLSDRVMKPLPKDMQRVYSAEDLIYHRAVVSCRQGAEWGMRALQGTWARLKESLPWRERSHHPPRGALGTCTVNCGAESRVLHCGAAPSLRRRLLMCIMHMHQLRTRCVGGNQITTVFDSKRLAPFERRDYSHLQPYFTLPL